MAVSTEDARTTGNHCFLQHYHLEKAFNNFHIDFVNKIIDSHIVFPPSTNVNVKGTTYAEYRDGKLQTFELQEEVTKFEVKNIEIKNVDFISIRSEFYKKTLEHGLEQKRKILKEITENATPIPSNKDDDIITKYFQLLRQAKKIGPGAVIMSHPDTYSLFMKELQKPENQQRIREETEKMNSEQSEQ